MSFTLFFPKQGADDGAYKNLIEEHEVYEALCEEVRTSIEGLGSEGYDLDLPEWPWVSTAGVTFHSTEEIEQDELAHYEWVSEGHNRGIEKQVTLWAPQIFNELWVRYRTNEDGVSDVAVDNTTHAKLPDGVLIALREEDD